MENRLNNDLFTFGLDKDGAKFRENHFLGISPLGHFKKRLLFSFRFPVEMLLERQKKRFSRIRANRRDAHDVSALPLHRFTIVESSSRGDEIRILNHAIKTTTLERVDNINDFVHGRFFAMEKNHAARTHDCTRTKLTVS